MNENIFEKYLEKTCESEYSKAVKKYFDNEQDKNEQTERDNVIKNYLMDIEKE